MIIPPENRPAFRLVAPPKTVPTLKDAIESYLEVNGRPTPLRHLNNRYSGLATRLGTTIQDVLNSMVDEGRIGMRRFVELNRTFVFSADEWASCLEEHKVSDVWGPMERALRDVK